MAFEAILEISDTIAQIALSGELDASTAPLFKQKIEQIPAADIEKLILIVKDLEYMSSAGLRVLIFSKQKMGSHVQIYVVSPQEMILETLEKTGFHHSVTIVDEYEAVPI
jgi:anti-anti-sigma factor